MTKIRWLPRAARRTAVHGSAGAHLRHRARRLRRGRRRSDRARGRSRRHRRGLSRRRLARLWRRRRRRRSRARRICRARRRCRPADSRRRRSRRAICSKAPRMQPSSAALPPRPHRSGATPTSIMLDMTDPRRPRARPLAAALARIVRARAINPRFIAGQMRHGPRGAAELAETVDRLVDFAETTGAVPSALLDLVHDAYLVDPRGARLPDAGKSRGRARHRRAARAGAAARPVASAPQRHRREPWRRCVRGGGMNAPSIADAVIRCAAAPVRDCRRRWRPATALLARLTPSGATISLDAVRRPVRGGAAPRQRHHRDHLARQHPDSRPERRVGAACSPRTWQRSASRRTTAFPCCRIRWPGSDEHERLDAGALAHDMRRALAAASFASRLSAKVSVIVDGGGALHLDDVAADVRLRAIGGNRFHVALAGGTASAATPLGAVPSDRAAECVTRLLGLLAAVAPQLAHARCDRRRRLERMPRRARRNRRAGRRAGRASRRRAGRHAPAAVRAIRCRRRLAVRAFGRRNVVPADRRGGQRRRGRPAHRARPRAAGGRPVAGRRERVRVPTPTRSASSSIPPIRAAGWSPARARRSARRAKSPPRAMAPTLLEPRGRCLGRRDHPCVRLRQGLRASGARAGGRVRPRRALRRIRRTARCRLGAGRRSAEQLGAAARPTEHRR